MEKKVYNFQEFLIECYIGDKSNPINEGKGGEDIDEALVLRILDMQKKNAENWQAKHKGKKMTLAQKIAFESREFYDKLSDSEKKAILDALIKKATRLKVDGDWIDKKVRKGESDEGKLLTNPRIAITEKSTVIEEPPKEKVEPKEEIEETPQIIQLIPDDIQGTFFKDNQWEYNRDNLSKSFQENYTVDGASVKGEEMVKKIVDSMKALVAQDFKMKGKSIKSIKILASCSRYRNRGDAEKLSWAQLGFNRTLTFAKMFGAAAEEASGKDAAFVKSIRDKIKVDYLGGNGDGTSGPDPIEKEFKRGYYDSKGWHDTKPGDTLDINVVKVEVKPTGITLGGVTKTKAKDEQGNVMTKELSDKSEYEPFKYLAIEIETLPLVTDGDETPDEDEEPKKTTTMPVETKSYKFMISLYKSSGKKRKGGGFGGGGFIRPSRSPKKRKFSVNACPVF